LKTGTLVTGSSQSCRKWNLYQRSGSLGIFFNF